MTNEEKSIQYADEKLMLRDKEYALSKYHRHTKMGTILFDGSDIEEAFFDGSKWKQEQLIEKAIGWIDYNNRNGGCWFDGWENDFKRAMEEL